MILTILYLALLVAIIGLMYLAFVAYPEYEFVIIVLALVIFCHGVLVALHIRA